MAVHRRSADEETVKGSWLRHFAESRGEHRRATPRPWLLALWAATCSALVIVGSFGPWVYTERVSQSAPAAWTDSGTAIFDGWFGILFAVGAMVALGVAQFRPDAGAYAWVALAAFSLCAVIGLANWFMFLPPEAEVPPGGSGTIVRYGWGVKLVGLAGLAGVAITWVMGRIINDD